ncbi:hypothetical protein ABL78_5693 [Leptomonas seymouri]|uniref:Uncharacterized protein n=1 Tax=Leptomonas seymouri TaxID=5684 RepID=A0A0N1IJ13_LEPSE|nr:hypothetical protein ABL78_5693 [Leptomonas seymouri]|eukprot:KPI85240.1 hypothetical protein ABL78_5693 [Leptomonas seymouri]
MDITPSSSRALRQRLKSLFSSYSTVEADAITAGVHAPVPKLTKSSFVTCIDALARRSTFQGIFIGSESDTAIREAAAQLQTSATQEILWKAALAYDGNRAAQHPPVNVDATNELASNDHFAEDDFFGETCYRSGRACHSASRSVNTFTDRFAEGTKNVSWRGFEAAVVLYLFDQHHFVHSFLSSEIAALRCPRAVRRAEESDKEMRTNAEKALAIKGLSSPSGKVMRTPTAATQAASARISPFSDTCGATDVRAAPDFEPLHSQSIGMPAVQRRTGAGKEESAAESRSSSHTSDGSPRCELFFFADAVTPPRKGIFDTAAAVSGYSAQQEHVLSLGNAVGGRHLPLSRASSTKLQVSSPNTYTPKRREQVSQLGGDYKPSADHLDSPTPPLMRKPTQREGDELLTQHHIDPPQAKFASSNQSPNVTSVCSTSQTQKPVLARLQSTNNGGSKAETCPCLPTASFSVSVSASSSSSYGQNTHAAAVAPTTASILGLCPPHRTSSASPSPRRPEDLRGTTEAEEAALITTGKPAWVVAAPLCLDAHSGGLRLRSPFELNATPAQFTVKASPHPRKSKERNPAFTKIPEPTMRNTISNPDSGAAPTAEAEVKRPKLACASGKARGQRRVYTTRRPHTGVKKAAAAAQGITAAATTTAAVAAGSQEPLCVAQRHMPARASLGWNREPPIDVEPPPTTRNEEALFSRRTSSPSPCIPPGAGGVEQQQHGQCSDGRSGTVEHAVDGRRTTALPVQLVDGMMAGLEGRGGGRARSWQPDEVSHASPEKLPPSPLAQEQRTALRTPSPSLREGLWEEDTENFPCTQPQQPPTQTSRRHSHQQALVPQSSPLPSTREPFAPASEASSRHTSATLEVATQPPFTAAPTMGEREGRGSRRLPAVRRATAPSPTPTPRDEWNDSTARPSAFSTRNSVIPAQSPELALPTPPPPSSQTSAPQPKPQQAHRELQQSTPAVAAAPPSQPRQKQYSQCTRAPSPSQLIGVPRILSSSFTSPLSVRASLGSASPRQYSANPSFTSQHRQGSSNEKRQRQLVSRTAAHTDPQAEMKAMEEGSCRRTPARHWSPETADMFSQTPTNLPSSVVRQHEPSRFMMTTPRQAPQQQQNEVTTPPPRLSHRARVRSSSRRGCAGFWTPPRVPQTRVQVSPSGSLQVTPRRRAPSTSSLI